MNIIKDLKFNKTYNSQVFVYKKIDEQLALVIIQQIFYFFNFIKKNNE